MFGVTINNRLINELIDSSQLTIEPFEKKLLKNIHYPLHIDKIKIYNTNRDWKVDHSFTDQKTPYELSPNQYVQVVIKEQIKLPKGLVGRFIPTSNLIDDGLGLTAGRIEYPFGNKSEYIHFGLHNLMDIKFNLSPNYKVAYVEFIDVRGLSNDRVHISKDEVRRYMQRLVGVKSEMEMDGGAMHDEDVDYFVNF